MANTYTRLFLLLIIFNYANKSFSQCNPDLTVAPAFDCFTAANSAVNGSGTGFVCDLDGFCINTGTVPTLDPPPVFCSANSVLNNPIWFSFIADDTGFLDIDVNTSGCSGAGVQWALYDVCGSLNNAVACQSNPVIPSGVPFNISAAVTPGATYYLVIDGANGSTCNYEFNVNNGISPIFVGDAIGTTLIGSTMVCGGSTVNYSFPGIQFGTDYHWTLPNGSTIDSEGPGTVVTFPEGMTPGPYQLCVTASNDCDPNEDATPICWDIIVMEEPIFDITEDVCQGNTFKFRGGNYAPGNYTFNYKGPFGSSCDTTYNLNILPIPNVYGPDQQVYKCPNDQFAFVGGVPFPSGPSANIVTFVSGRGCDSLVNFYINDVAISGTVQASPAALPCGGSATSTLSLSPGFVFPPDAYGIKWYNALDVEIGMGGSTMVNTPGYYYAVVTTFMNNNSNPIVEPQNVMCTQYFPVTITAENSTLIMPLTAGPTTLCAGENYTFDVTNMQAGVLSYSWQHVDGTLMGVGNGPAINLSYTTAGNYDICVNAVDGCGPGPQTCFPIQVVPSPTVILESSYAVCAKNDSLTAVLGGIPDLTDPLLQYVWIAKAGPDISGVVFTPANKAETVVTVGQAGKYTFEFTADYNGQGCGESKTIDVTFEEALVLTPENIKACNDILQPLPSMIDLDTLISGNIAYTGTWTMVSGPGTPSGTLPIQDFTGMSNTGKYVYEYTPNQLGICLVTPVQVEIDLQNCICPPLSIAPNAGTTCNDVGTIDLNSTIQGATGAGTWTVTNKPVGSTVMVAGGVANFGSQPAGTYDFTYTLSTSMAGCPSTAMTTVTIMAAPVATLKTVEQACNSNFSPTYVNEVDFDTLVLSGVTGGVWTYTGPGGDPGSASFNPKDFNGAKAGTYEYTYTIMGDPSCQPVSYSIDIIVEDCKCPSVAISPEESFCNTVPAINLNDYKVTTKAGAWFIESGPIGSTATITGGNMFVGSGSAYGEYVLYYKLDAGAPVGCSDTAQLILTLDSTAFAGSNDIYDRCADFGSSVDLDTVLSQQQGGGTWLYTGGPNIGSAFNATTGVLDFNSLPEGAGYTFNYTVASPLGLCPAATSTLTLTKNALPVADAGSDGNIDCVIETVSIGGPNTTTGSGIIYNWTNTTNSTSAGNTSTVSGIADAGIYELEVTNTLTGCVERDVVEVTKDNAAISAINYELDSITCYNKADAQISIIDISGGTPSFKYSIDGGSYGSKKDFANLGPGNHTIEVEDENGCHYLQKVLIDNPVEVKVELGTNKVIAEGDVVTISPDISIDVQGTTIVWSSNPEGTSCNNCPQLTVNPMITTVYTVLVRNENGCIAEDSIEIRVKSLIRVFIPTAISPNNDGINDVFYIQSDLNVVKVNKLMIYNRWGDVQFSIADTPPNDPAYGWNGRFGDQRSNTPAVFVYFAILKLRDGREVTYKGDVTVVK